MGLWVYYQEEDKSMQLSTTAYLLFCGKQQLLSRSSKTQAHTEKQDEEEKTACEGKKVLQNESAHLLSLTPPVNAASLVEWTKEETVFERRHQ